MMAPLRGRRILVWGWVALVILGVLVVLLIRSRSAMGAGAPKQQSHPPGTISVDPIPVPGKEWTLETSGTTNNLYSIYGINVAEKLWAVGANGTILESDDQGATWMARKSGTSNDLYAVSATYWGDRVWAVGANGTMLESDNGGATWRVRKSGTTNALRALWISTEDKEGKWLCAAGDRGTIVESVDGGTTWTVRNSGTTRNFASVVGISNPIHLWITGDSGTIMVSGDEGKTWKAESSGTDERLVSIWVPGWRNGGTGPFWIATSNGAILASQDGKAPWDTLRGDGGNPLIFITGTMDGMDLWAVGGGGTILGSDDRGASWKLRKSGTSETLNASFTTGDNSAAWAVGDHGVILESDETS